MEKITLDEHYARLYGPAVLASRHDASGAVEKPRVDMMAGGAEGDYGDDGVFFNSADESVHLRTKKVPWL